MSNPTPPVPPVVPPPVPPTPVGYSQPGMKSAAKTTTDTQRVFDTVVGPNLRLKDNLIQLASVFGGAVVGAGIGFAIAKPADQIGFAMLGGVGGVLGGLVISGVVIGIVRLVRK